MAEMGEGEVSMEIDSSIYDVDEECFRGEQSGVECRKG